MKSQFAGKAVAVSLLTLVACLAQAQQYPAKPVRVVVPFAPGGGSDITARQFSNNLSEYLGQQFVVDNRGGAGGLIGMEQTARAPADGYTIMMMSGSFSATSAVQQPAFDPINSIIAVAEFGYTPFVLAVHPSLPAKSVKELIALARSTKGGLSYAGTGTGGATHLATELFSSMAKIKMVAIQYKSTGAAMSDLLGGQVPVIVGSLLPVTPHLPTGKLRALGVTTEKRRRTLVRNDDAARHAAAHHPGTQCRHQQGAAGRGHQAKPGTRRHDPQWRNAAGFRPAHPQGLRTVDEGRQGSRAQAG